MANFRDTVGHNSVSIITSLLVSGIFTIFIKNNGYNTDLIDAGIITSCAYLAGIAPDIDSVNSIPNKAVKYISYMVVIVLSISGNLPVITPGFLYSLGLKADEIPVVSALIQLLALYISWGAFDRVVNHRGHFHSVLAAVCFAVFFTILSSRFISEHAKGFVFAGTFIGYCSHLILDDLTTRTKNKAFRFFARSSNVIELAVLLLIPVSIAYLYS